MELSVNGDRNGDDESQQPHHPQRRGTIAIAVGHRPDKLALAKK
jgi:hypothetical protein